MDDKEWKKCLDRDLDRHGIHVTDQLTEKTKRAILEEDKQKGTGREESMAKNKVRLARSLGIAAAAVLLLFVSVSIFNSDRDQEKEAQNSDQMSGDAGSSNTESVANPDYEDFDKTKEDNKTKKEPAKPEEKRDSVQALNCKVSIELSDGTTYATDNPYDEIYQYVSQIVKARTEAKRNLQEQEQIMADMDWQYYVIWEENGVKKELFFSKDSKEGAGLAEILEKNGS